MDPTARILRLLSLLQTYRHWPGEELSDRLGVSPRTLRRDVDRLRELGYPVDTEPRDRRRLPALGRHPDPAAAAGRRGGGGDRGRAANGGRRRGRPGIEETSLQALAKLQQVLPPRLRRRVDALADATETTVFSQPAADDPGRHAGRGRPGLPRTASSCGSATRRRDGTETSRLVEPHRLVARGRRWYLVAWDLQRDAWRTFRVDRLSHPFANGVRFTPRELPAEDAAAYVTQALRNVPRGNEALLAIPLPLAEARSRSRAGSAS